MSCSDGGDVVNILEKSKTKVKTSDSDIKANYYTGGR